MCVPPRGLKSAHQSKIPNSRAAKPGPAPTQNKVPDDFRAEINVACSRTLAGRNLLTNCLLILVIAIILYLFPYITIMSTVQVKVSQGIATITFNRPRSLNAIQPTGRCPNQSSTVGNLAFRKPSIRQTMMHFQKLFEKSTNGRM